MKDSASGGLTRGGRRRDSRARKRRLQELCECGPELTGATRKKKRLRKEKNWRVRKERGEVLAIEPGGVYENTFNGGQDPFMQALEYAAKQLRGGPA